MNTRVADFKPTILYIEDDLASMDIVRKIVVSCDYNFVWAGFGIAGISKARLLQPDIIFVDIELHDIQGYEVVRTIRAFDLKTPIIVITAHDIKEVQQEIVQAGGSELLQKPIRYEILKSLIHKYLPEAHRS